MKVKIYWLGILAALLVVLSGSSCDNNTGSYSQEAGQVNQQEAQYNNTQPVPFFEWSLPRHMEIELYKAQNDAVSTFSYVFNPYLGKIVFSCPSIGYPIPGGTQLTNPEVATYSGSSGLATLPQPEPNGLYSPGTSLGTYVFCVNPDGSVSPQYVEDNVIAATYPMEVVNGQLQRVADSKSSISISTKQDSAPAPKPSPTP